jgi:hypothetical protein
MRFVLPVRIALGYEFQICFVDQRGRLQGVIGAFKAQMVFRHAM